MNKRQANKITSDLPVFVYVVREQDGDRSYILASEDLDGIDNGTVVGRYGLLEVGEIEVTRRLKP